MDRDLEQRISEFRERMNIPAHPMEPDESTDEPTRTPDQIEAERWQFKLSMCRVPKVYEAVPQTLYVPDALKDWHKRNWSLSLLGPTGCGKTWLAVKLLTDITHELFRGRFADSTLAIEQIKDEFTSDYRGKTMRELSTIPVLLLDDLGAERGTEYQVEQIGLILRARYNAQLLTIITSNAAKIDDVVESRIASRLASGVFPVRGKDRRLTK